MEGSAASGDDGPGRDADRAPAREARCDGIEGGTVLLGSVRWDDHREIPNVEVYVTRGQHVALRVVYTARRGNPNHRE